MRDNPDLVCSKCYAAQMEQFRSNMQPALLRNTALLKESVLSDWDLPVINALAFRFSSFGELENETHFINLINICNKNPNTFFSLWTKRSATVQYVLNRLPKPKNLNLIYSSPILNKEATLPKYFDKVFTVYTEEPDNVNFHGKCKDCMACYQPNSTVFIREMLKKPSKKR